MTVGTSLAALQCWDNHRAIDYLVSREDIDADRIGVWGSSGGGTGTTYLIGMDERVKVAAIYSYFSGRERTLELQGPSDGCQHIHHEGEAGIELADFALMMAPNRY
ncbi:MAG: prolyl oligopeptidase family serine peptidase [Bacteroides sp.]|nr:prolyl oligopeptidase family serine peptidase [Bacteroides sp.]